MKVVFEVGALKPGNVEEGIRSGRAVVDGTTFPLLVTSMAMLGSQAAYSLQLRPDAAPPSDVHTNVVWR